MPNIGIVLWCLFVVAKLSDADNLPITNAEAKNYLLSIEPLATDLCNKQNLADWNFNTNLTDFNLNKTVEASLNSAKLRKQVWENITQYDWKSLTDPSLKRQYEFLSIIDISALPEEKLQKFEEYVSAMENKYGQIKICPYKNQDSTNCTLSLDPDITLIMADSRDFDELLYTWQQWHTKVGRTSKHLFKPYVELGNEAAKLNDKKDFGELWRAVYFDPDLESEVKALWEQLKPFYMELHAYVRRKLHQKYGDKVNLTGPVPAHLFGNMWAQDWNNILDIVQPFPNAKSVDITKSLVQQKYTQKQMVEKADDFYASINMKRIPEAFWKNSMITKPTDGREVVCHASAWDFCTGKDFRIKMCTKVNNEDFVVVHHEMGHIQYFMQYANQPYAFRDGANPGFHEAIGDTIALSVATPKHLQRIGLLNNISQSKEDELAFLFRMALQKLAFLPFGYVIDYWRWQVFSGKIPEEKWNEEWWSLRRELQGIYPYIDRTPEDFDPIAKYHVSANVPYISYFIAAILQQQFHKSLCIEAGEYNPTNPASKPLHQCDIYQSEKAGNKLAAGLQLGSSKPWPEVLLVLTGQQNLDAGPMLEYYQPLYDFLKQENIKNGDKPGWV